MGRTRIFRQNLISRVQSVAVKNPYSWLVRMTMEEYGLPVGEAELVAGRAYHYLTHCRGTRGAEQILFELIAGRESHSRRDRGSSKAAVLTPFCHEDLELLEEFGLTAMQNGRIFRLIEEAYVQDALFSMAKLSFLLGMEKNAIHDRLLPLWREGVRLPVAGMERRLREGFRQFRGTMALRELARGRKPSEVRRRLSLTRSQVGQYRLELEYVAQGMKEALGQHIPLELLEEYEVLSRELDLGQQIEPKVEVEDTREGFVRRLREEHSFSPAKAQDYLERLEEFICEEFGDERAGNTVVYYAISADEPAGKAVAECRLVPVELEYYTDEELKGYTGTKTKELKWGRLLRLTTQARKGGGLLTQSDLSFLLGVDVGVIQKLKSENKEVVIPTRGQVNDIGPGLTHVEKIVELYLQGYTETQICQRTGHTYESVENYLKTFAAVATLSDRGLPVLMIRKAIGKSKKLVECHLNLYRRYKELPEAALVLRQLRESFIRGETEKEEKKDFFPATLRKEGDTIKRRANRYAPSLEKSLESAQHYMLTHRFDFGKESWLAERLIREFDSQIEAYERSAGIQRLMPGDLLTLYKGREVIIPLLDPDICRSLAEDGLWSRHSLLLEDARLRALQAYDSDATREDLRKLVNIRGLVFGKDKITQKTPRGVMDWPLVDPKEVSCQLAQRRLAKDDVSVASEVTQHMMREMTVKERISRERANAIIEELAYIRALYCPLKSELKPGQVAWIGISTRDRQQEEKDTRYREQVALILTLQAPDEIGQVPGSLAEVNALHQRQIARMCVEAYLQGAVLSLTDLQFLTFRSAGTIGKLINNYMVEHQVILPTPGTIKDAGRALTHKHLVIGLHMEGLYTKEIAQKTFHSPEAVDRYLDLFNAVLILYIYDLPVDLMARVTRRGRSLIEEHLNIVKEYFPDKEAVKSYLRARGLKIS